MTRETYIRMTGATRRLIARLPGGSIFVNGLSINDPQSTQVVFERLAKRFDWDS